MAQQRTFIRILPAVSLVAAVVGGLFVGQFSCGAHSWQAPAITSLVGIVGASAALLRARPSGSWNGRPRPAMVRALTFLVLVAVVFVVAEGLGA